ncbi:MAG: glycosyltransferase family 39 protein, partial [Planctomycetota bacterium]
MENRTFKIIFAGIIIISSAMYLLNTDFQRIGWFNDDANYINNARWIAGIQNTYKNTAASSLGYSLILAPVALLSPVKNDAFRIPSLLFSVGSLFLIYLLFRRNLSRKFILLLLFMISLSPLFVAYSGTVLSEPAFTFFSLLVLYLLNRYLQKNIFSIGMLIWISICLALLSFIRNEGFLLAGSIFAFLLFRKQKNNLLYMLLFFMLFISPVFILNIDRTVDKYLFGWSTPIFTKQYLGMVLKSLIYFIESMINSVILTGFLKDKIKPVIILVDAVIMYLYIKGFFRDRSTQVSAVIKLYIVLYIIVHIVWQARGQRFIVPILPFLLLYYLDGLKCAGRKIMIAACALNILLFLHQDFIFAVSSPRQINPQTFSYVRKNTESDAVFVTNFAPR